MLCFRAHKLFLLGNFFLRGVLLVSKNSSCYRYVARIADVSSSGFIVFKDFFAIEDFRIACVELNSERFVKLVLPVV